MASTVSNLASVRYLRVSSVVQTRAEIHGKPNARKLFAPRARRSQLGPLVRYGNGGGLRAAHADQYLAFRTRLALDRCSGCGVFGFRLPLSGHAQAAQSDLVQARPFAAQDGEHHRDGFGATSAAMGSGKNLEVFQEIHFPHSLGLLYSAFTYYTGFKVNSGAGRANCLHAGGCLPLLYGKRA